ncbi:methyltransferase type 11 [Marinitoga sp. 38H-ov]|nr:methyltransferase type 11 [Marinitoga sp. 38H-ov]
MKKKYNNNSNFDNIVNEILLEIKTYEKYSEYYGYVFYICRKL